MDAMCPATTMATSVNTDKHMKNKETSSSAKSSRNRSRNDCFKEKLESAVGLAAKRKIESILTDVNSLGDVEKLLLYLRLPTGFSEGDVSGHSKSPPSMPNTSREEHAKAYNWICSHLEESPDTSMPKQDVYEEYKAYCDQFTLTAICPADFGKIMKGVFPNMKRRRLGTRGKSRYCYSGIRKKTEMKSPILPLLEVGRKPKQPCHLCPDHQLVTSASDIVSIWAKQVLNCECGDVLELAQHLLKEGFVSKQSIPAVTLLAGADDSSRMPKLSRLDQTDDSWQQRSPEERHRETQHQLHLKIQQRQITKQKKEEERSKHQVMMCESGTDTSDLKTDQSEANKKLSSEVASTSFGGDTEGVGNEGVIESQTSLMSPLVGSSGSTNLKDSPRTRKLTPIQPKTPHKSMQGVCLIPVPVQPTDSQPLKLVYVPQTGQYMAIPANKNISGAQPVPGGQAIISAQACQNSLSLGNGKVIVPVSQVQINATGCPPPNSNFVSLNGGIKQNISSLTQSHLNLLQAVSQAQKTTKETILQNRLTHSGVQIVNRNSFVQGSQHSRLGSIVTSTVQGSLTSAQAIRSNDNRNSIHAQSNLSAVMSSLNGNGRNAQVLNVVDVNRSVVSGAQTVGGTVQLGNSGIQIPSSSIQICSNGVQVAKSGIQSGQSVKTTQTASRSNQSGRNVVNNFIGNPRMVIGAHDLANQRLLPVGNNSNAQTILLPVVSNAGDNRQVFTLAQRNQVSRSLSGIISQNGSKAPSREATIIPLQNQQILNTSSGLEQRRKFLSQGIITPSVQRKQIQDLSGDQKVINQAIILDTQSLDNMESPEQVSSPQNGSNTNSGISSLSQGLLVATSSGASLQQIPTSISIDGTSPKLSKAGLTPSASNLLRSLSESARTNITPSKSKGGGASEMQVNLKQGINPDQAKPCTKLEELLREGNPRALLGKDHQDLLVARSVQSATRGKPGTSIPVRPNSVAGCLTTMPVSQSQKVVVSSFSPVSIPNCSATLLNRLSMVSPEAPSMSIGKKHATGMPTVSGMSSAMMLPSKFRSKSELKASLQGLLTGNSQGLLNGTLAGLTPAALTPQNLAALGNLQQNLTILPQNVTAQTSGSPIVLQMPNGSVSTSAQLLNMIKKAVIVNQSPMSSVPTTCSVTVMQTSASLTPLANLGSPEVMMACRSTNTTPMSQEMGSVPSSPSANLGQVAFFVPIQQGLDPSLISVNNKSPIKPKHRQVFFASVPSSSGSTFETGTPLDLTFEHTQVNNSQQMISSSNIGGLRKRHHSAGVLLMNPSNVAQAKIPKQTSLGPSIQTQATNTNTITDMPPPSLLPHNVGNYSQHSLRGGKPAKGTRGGRDGLQRKRNPSGPLLSAQQSSVKAYDVNIPSTGNSGVMFVESFAEGGMKPSVARSQSVPLPELSESLHNFITSHTMERNTPTISEELELERLVTDAAEEQTPRGVQANFHHQPVAKRNLTETLQTMPMEAIPQAQRSSEIIYNILDTLQSNEHNDMLSSNVTVPDIAGVSIDQPLVIQTSQAQSDLVPHWEYVNLTPNALVEATEHNLLLEQALEDNCSSNASSIDRELQSLQMGEFESSNSLNLISNLPS